MSSPPLLRIARPDGHELRAEPAEDGEVTLRVYRNGRPLRGWRLRLHRGELAPLLELLSTLV